MPLRPALSRAPVDLIDTGDCQHTERKFGLSRRMLEVCLQLSVPVSVLERSPLLLCDLNLLQQIHQWGRAVMIWSIVTRRTCHRVTF